MSVSNINAIASTLPANYQGAVSLQDLSSNLAMLDALMTHTCGESSGSFNTMDEDQRDWYLSHCSRMVLDCRKAAVALVDQAAAEFRADIMSQRVAVV